MCGICGVVGLHPPEQAAAAVRRMVDAMIHRGPDDQGVLRSSPVALGMRRLSIIDLAGGGQPIFNERGDVAAILNGEVYNFRELRRELESLGHVFRTHADTESVVHAWEQWGGDCVQHLRGMFAFALLETEAGRPKQLFLARDRLGIKPLYYAHTGDVFVFASEVRALLASGLVERRLCADALHSYLLFGSVAEPMTLVEGVRSLPPGHCLALDLSRPAAQPHIVPYWGSDALRPPIRRRPAANGTGSAAPQVRELVEQAVRQHLIADVPLGVFLSSGIDSTAIAAVASRERQGIHTFTVAFLEQEFSEAQRARATAEQLGTTHQELVLDGNEMLARLDSALAALDQPSMDGVNTYFVSWAARQAGLKVALSGLGGDEVFGGYPAFRTVPQLERLQTVARAMPASIRARTAPVVSRLSGHARGAERKIAEAWSQPDALPHPYYFTRALFAPGQASALLNGAAPRRDHSDWWRWLDSSVAETEGWPNFSRISWLESRSYLVNTLLRDTDAMSMAHSLEVRVPFLDHVLVEKIGRLPESAKWNPARQKALLVESLRDLLPAEVISQPKRTFTLPWERWLRGPLRERVAGGLRELTPTLCGALSSQSVRSVWNDFAAGTTTWSRPWALYVLNEWVRRHLDSSAG